MAQFTFNRFPMEPGNQNTQWNNSVHLTGNSNFAQPFQRPSTPAVRPQQQHEAFPQYSGQNRPPFSNVPPQANLPEFSTMLPPNNQAFNVNINSLQNFPNTPDYRNFVRTPDPQNFPRVISPQNFHGAHTSQNFPGVPSPQNFPVTTGLHNIPGAPAVQNFPGTLNLQHFSGASNPQHFSGPQNFPVAPVSESFPTMQGSQTFSGVSAPQNFQRPFYPQNFPRSSDPQNFPGAQDPQNFPRAPNLQNFPRPPDPLNFPRPPDPLNFPRPPDPQNFPRPPDHQNFPRPQNPQNFPRPQNPQNFPQPQIPQNFQQPPDPQSFLRVTHHQDFPRLHDPQNLPGVNNNSPNFSRGPNFQNFSALPTQSSCQADSNLHNFSRAPDSPRGTCNPQGFQRMSSPKNFTGSPDLHHSPVRSNAQNFHGEPTFNKFPPMSGSSQRLFTPWKQFTPGGQRTRSWESNTSRQFRDYSSQENKRGFSKVRNFKKLKEDNKEKPFSCDTCDRAFETETDLKDHISQHITCNHANCTFEAHPKIVALHKKMQHDTGYAERINKLKDAEEIKKWREERKRRFPTAENIQKRQAEQAEREARGEVLETKEFGKFKRRKEGYEMNTNDQRRRGQRFKRRNDRRKNFIARSQTFTVNDNSETDSDSDSHIKLHRFPGMLSSTNPVDEGINDSEVKDSTSSQADNTSDCNYSGLQNSSEQNVPKFQSEDNFSQSAVLCSDGNSNNQTEEDRTIKLNDDKFYDSDNEAPIAEPFVKCVEKSILTNKNLNAKEDDVNVSVCEIPNDKSGTEQRKNVELVQVADSDDESPTVVPITKSFENSPSVDNKSDENKADQENLTESTKAQGKVTENGYNKNCNKSNRYSRNQHHQQNGQNFVQVRKSSLLEKLLADDIRHERNVILQCIRHIVKNNFFGIESNAHK